MKRHNVFLQQRTAHLRTMVSDLELILQTRPQGGRHDLVIVAKQLGETIDILNLQSKSAAEEIRLLSRKVYDLRLTVFRDENRQSMKTATSVSPGVASSKP